MTFSSPLLDRLRVLRNTPSAAPQHAATQQARPAPSLPPLPVFPPTVGPERLPPKPRPQSTPRPVLNRPPASPAASPPEVAPPATVPSPKVLDLLGLPAQLGQLVSLAQAGKLPRGPQQLASGLVLDLGGYVLSWAECWPRDSEHVQRRLLEAHEVINRDH